MIPYGHQDISEEDVAAVVEVLRSDRITQGEMVPRFEQQLCDLTGAGYAVTTNSATSALHLACRVLGVGEGDMVWTSPNTFVASANCARYCGAEVDFVDINPATGNLSVAALEQKLASATRPPAVLIAVHFAGQSCEMAALKSLADRYGFSIIEDASHALGASYRGQPVGGGRFSDITVFSFHPVKLATTGEGGALLCNDGELARRAIELRSHGVTRDAGRMTTLPVTSWSYEQQELGFNYRLTDIQAALGCSQLKRLPQFIDRRRDIARHYLDVFEREGIESLSVTEEGAVHLFVIQVAPQHRGQIFDQLQERGIGVNVHYIPVYWQPYYQRLGFAMGLCPASETYYRRAISLPVYPSLSDEQQDYVIEQVLQVVSQHE